MSAGLVRNNYRIVGGRVPVTVWGRLAVAHECGLPAGRLFLELDVGQGCFVNQNYWVSRNPDADPPDVAGRQLVSRAEPEALPHAVAEGRDLIARFAYEVDAKAWIEQQARAMAPKVPEGLVAFLYVLLRDELPAGAVEALVRDHVEKVETGADCNSAGLRVYSNKPLEAYARELAGRISK